MEPELSEIDHKKLAILRSMLEIAQNQAELLLHDDIEGLIKAMDRRQDLMDEWDKLPQQAVNDSALPMKESIQEVFRSIEKLDISNKITAQKKLDEYRVQVKHARENQRGISAYINPRPRAEGVYIDTKK